MKSAVIHDVRNKTERGLRRQGEPRAGGYHGLSLGKSAPRLAELDYLKIDFPLERIALHEVE